MVLRGIIIEIKDKYSIVMKDNGSMVRVRNKEGLKVGDAILFLEEDIYGKNNILNFADFKVWKPMIAVAACLMLVLLFAYNRNSYTDYALLSMDVNPSIQFKLDKDGNIVDILGLNNDGEKILDKHLLGKSLEEGLSKLKLLMEEKNYLKDDSPILVGFAYLEDINDDEYEENVKSLLKKIYSKNEILYLKSNSLRANESLKRKLSVGRLEALESIAAENIKTNIESISVEEIKENISKSNRTEIFSDDYMDEDDDYDEIDDDWDHENSDNDHEDRLEDKIDKKNNNTDNDETDDENEYEEEDSSVNTNTFTNKESKYDNIEGNKSNDDYEDEIDNKGNDYNDEQKEENKEEDDDNDENGYNNSDINTDDKSKNNSQNHKESENENINESNHEEKEDNNTEAYNEKDSNRNSLSNDSKNNSSDNIESSSNADNSSDNDSND